MNLETLVRTKALMDCDPSELMMEVKKEYSYSLNSMIFDKYLSESSGDLVPHSLVLPPKPEDNEVPYYGLLPVNKGPEVFILSPTDVIKVILIIYFMFNNFLLFFFNNF